jgi:hypothetical protein
VEPRAILEAVVKRKILSPRRKSNPRTPIVQPGAQRYTWEIYSSESVIAEKKYYSYIEERIRGPHSFLSNGYHGLFPNE